MAWLGGGSAWKHEEAEMCFCLPNLSRDALPPSLALIVGEFETFLVGQKKTSDEMSKYTDAGLREVGEKASLQLQVGWPDD